ncbi:MAG: hypothetical protein OES79_04615 [Planctomycetota bacterium]|nr:hypothetical protein [Planctomycetota bacterium]
MNRAVLILAIVISAALVFTAALRAQNAKQPDRYANVTNADQIQQTGFDRHSTDYSADKKFPNAKPLLQGIFGQRSPSHSHLNHDHTHHNRLRSNQPTPVVSSTTSVPQRIRREAPQLEVSQPPQEIVEQVVEEETSLDVQPIYEPAGDEVYVADGGSSRRVQPLEDQSATAPLEAITPNHLSGNDISQPIDNAWDGDAAPAVTSDDTESNPMPAEIGSSAKPAAATADNLLISRKSAVLVVETLGPRQTVIGKEATFQVNLQNLGEVSANGVEVRVQTPQWAEITAANPSRGTAQGGASQNQPLIWTVDSLEARGSEVLNLRIVPRQSDAFDLAVAWTMQPNASQTMIEVKEPRLALAIAGPTEVRYGDTKIYKLTIANPGTGDAEHVQVQLMPIEGGDQPMAVQDLGTIAAGESTELEVELTARQAGYINIDASATAELGLHAKASEKVLVRRASLTVDVIGPAAKYTGTVANYKFRIANPGNAPAENLQIMAKMPGGSEFVDSTNGGRFDEATNTINWTVDALPSQREMVFSVQTKLNQAGTNALNVSAKADRELADSGAASTVVETLADLKLEISDPRGPLPVNEDMIYELRLWNRGSKAARNVEIVAFFSEGVEPVSVQGGTHRLGPGQVIFNAIPTLGVGDEVKFKIIAKAGRQGNHVFRAEVQCHEAGTRLAAEETTHFYDNQIMTARPDNASRTIRR